MFSISDAISTPVSTLMLNILQLLEDHDPIV